MKNLIVKLANNKKYVIIAKEDNNYFVINQDSKIVKTETSYNGALYFALGYLKIIEYF